MVRVLEVHYFDRSSGKKKCRTPFKTEDLNVSDVENLDRNFCKKDNLTGVQKQIRCLACRCQMESSGAAKSHLAGSKHSEAVKNFDPARSVSGKSEAKVEEKIIGETDIEVDLTTLPALILTRDVNIVGLNKVQEFICPSNEKASRMYKCQVYDCDGAFGSAEVFLGHLLSNQHILNVQKEFYLSNTPDSTEDFVSKNSSTNVDLMETIRDEERYWIQRQRKVSTAQLAPPNCAISSYKAEDGRRNEPTSGCKPAPSQAVVMASSLSKRKLDEACVEPKSDVKKAKLETKALKAKRPGFTDERYNETSYYHETESKLRKVYPYYFTFTTFTKGRWVGERILDVFSREFRAHPSEEYERCIKAGTLTVNYEKVDVDYRLKHNDLLANIVHRHEVPVSSEHIRIVHMDDDLVVVNKPASIPVHPCGRYRHNTVVFILAKEHGLKNLRTIHRLDRLTSGLLLFGRNPKKAREMEQQIRTRQVQKEYVCRVDGKFPEEPITCKEPIEVVSYKIGVCKVSPNGKDCHTNFQRLSFNGKTSVVLCRPKTGRMHQIRVHLQYLGYPVVNDPLYNHEVFGPEKGRGGRIGKTDEQLIQDLISIHNAENWLGMDEDGPPGGLGPPSVQLKAGLPESRRKSRPDTPDSAFDSSPASTMSIDYPVDNVGSCVKSQAPRTAGSVGSGKAAENNASEEKVTIATQTGIDEADKGFDTTKLSVDPHCYECKVKYRDPRPKDLVMFLHAWTYSGPDWKHRTELPNWARENWTDPDDYLD